MEVEVVEAEPGQRFLGAGDGLVETVVAAGDLARDEEVAAIDGALGDGATDLAFILVVDRGVEQSVTAFDAGADRFDPVIAGHRVGAEADLGDRAAVIEIERGNLSHASTLGPPRRPRPGAESLSRLPNRLRPSARA